MPENIKRTQKGLPVIECGQEIPCNPCVSVCRAGAISKSDLCAVPQLDNEKCNACRLCVAACPGQAIFFLEEEGDVETVAVTFPYEYLPLPEVGAMVTAVGRDGKPLCEAVVRAVAAPKAYNKTRLVTVSVPKIHSGAARSMRRLPKEDA